MHFTCKSWVYSPAMSIANGRSALHPVYQPTTFPFSTSGLSYRRPPTSPTGHTATRRVERICEKTVIERGRERCWVLQYSPAVLQCASNFLPFFRRAALSVFADMIKCLCAIMHPIHWWFSERGGSRLLFFGTLDSGREEATGSASASLLRDERGTFSTPMNPCCTCHDSRREAV